MFRKLKDVPDCLGNINGVPYDADITVRVTTNPKLRADMEEIITRDKINTISLNKTYHVHKIISFGDPFDVLITNDLGEEEEWGAWAFEDID